eukprot:Seg23.3 transcript_id=Seg23.3/GoldUCD/mRNA.D3Y31 product="Ankyrin repeat domain-containing protein 53" protein_id=Seg23.3/GoldUCD/D3Y31
MESLKKDSQPINEGNRSSKLHIIKARQLQTKSALQKRLEEDVLMAAKVGDAIWLQQSLETKKVDLHSMNDDGLSAIHLAALECQLDCLKILIGKKNLDVNFRSSDGWSPLHLAINNSNPEISLKCVEYLIAKGADPSSSTDFGLTPMHQASACGNVQCLQFLINAMGVIDGIDDRGHTPYSLATLWSRRKCARILQHYQWQKDKKSEDKVKKQMIEEAEIAVQQEEERKKREKADRRLKGQKAYQLWLSKNAFAEMPSLFGQEPVTGSAGSTRARSRQKSQTGRGKSLRKGGASRTETSKGAARSGIRMDFIPVNAPGSPTPGRRLQNDSDKRLPQNISQTRLKAVQKRGPLQFPVI